MEAQELVAVLGTSSAELVSDSFAGISVVPWLKSSLPETFSHEAKKTEVAIHLADLLANHAL